MTTYHLKVDNFWDIWEVLVPEPSLDVLPVFWKIYSFECFCFFIFVLKFG